MQPVTAFGWVVVVLLIVAFAATLGINPRGGRPVARTSLMLVARIVLLLLALLVVYATFRSP